MKEAIIRQIVEKIVNELEDKEPLAPDMCAQTTCNAGKEIPVEASGRHVHLCREHVEQLFGKGYVLTKQKALSQPGQYVCKERVDLEGPGGTINQVAILGPVREKTQVELSATDARTLGIKAPVRLSGDLKDAADIAIRNGAHTVDAKNAAIIAKIHLHINPSDAKRYGVHHGQHVSVTVNTARAVTFHDVIVRADAHAQNVLHMDYDEANACGFAAGDRCCINTGMHDQDHAPPDPVGKPEEFKVVTESRIQRLVSGTCSSLTFKSGTILTPLAKDIARENNITIRFV